ncbi:MAG: TolC family protein [Alphaproteobacteria bacterium]|nr:TolC family protein [Alphaproteobacteria bacterium]
MKTHLLIPSLLFGLLALPAHADPFDIEGEVTPVPKAPVCSTNATKEKLHLADVINLALCQNPQTQKLYMGALATAAEYGQTKSDYLPTLDFNAGINQSDTTIHHGRNSNSTMASAGLSLNWLLFDFGGREASTKIVRQSLNAALATRSDTLQSLIFEAAEAYYQVFAAQEEYNNSNATLAAALSAFEAAAKRYELGLAALSDKLQAETSYSEAQLSVTKAEESLALAKGRLAVLLNFSPDQSLDLYEEKYSMDNLMVPDNITNLLKTALNNRSDIQAKKAAVKQAESTLDMQKAQNAPSFNLSAGLNGQDELTKNGPRSHTSSVGLTMTVPLFTGFKNSYRTSQARYQLEQSKAELKQLENNIQQEVWTTYQNFITAKKTYEISLTMFASADQNAKVALGAYKAGKGSILNVLDAQSKLADVRTTKSQSFYDLLIAKTNMIRKIGLIDPFKTNKGF